MLKDFPTDELLQAVVPAYQKHLPKGDVEAFTGNDCGRNAGGHRDHPKANGQGPRTGSERDSQMEKENQGSTAKQPQSTSKPSAFPARIFFK
jgi:hypothetical protein